MLQIEVSSADQIGKNFIPAEYLPEGKDEFHLRNMQNPKPAGYWRHLHSHEIEGLVRNGNTCDNWDDFLVTDRFDFMLVKNSHFSGLVRIDGMEELVLTFHDIQMPVGISNSHIVSCDIGENVAVHNMGYMAHYIVGAFCMLLNIDELQTSNHAKFGNGILKDGESEDIRVWLDLINETGGRNVIPFDGMIPADAYIWAKYRDDEQLRKNLKEITQRRFSSQRGFYGTIGDYCVIKHTRIIKDVKMGSHCYVKGANKLKNITINSTQDEPAQIGEGVEMVNGIMGLGSRVFYGCKAVRFVMGNNCSLKYGARLINSFLGDNSTVSCCEMLNNLIFPAHEQHHNNSFLTASLLMGQSNLPAGATIGSNHNSRANDGEIQAGRGFWPGLCTSVKHSCRFASFTLLSKADYPAELDISLPFSLVSDDATNGCLRIMPAFWWLYNMYALARNTWKYSTRDKRKTKVQNIEFDSLAPDTAEEIIAARRLLEIWTAKAVLRGEKGLKSQSEDELARLGRKMISDDDARLAGLEILGENQEKSTRKILIVKALEGYRAYGEMLHHYAVKNLISYMQENKSAKLADMCKALSGPRQPQWANLGGQLMPETQLRDLLERINSGELKTWEEIHQAYDELWASYPLQKQRHAFSVLTYLLGTESLSTEQWIAALDEECRIQELICDRVYTSRKKDYDNPFRQATFRNPQEMKAVIGTAENNSFVKQVRSETEELKQTVATIKGRN
ncbi:MAG: DUF4954 family protein [Pirellulales bacterium]|nr:DUF4954 family protein [Pirellulales bacterium]